MEIKSVSGNLNFYKDSNIKKQQEVKQDVPKDRYEISAEAKALESSSKSVKNLNEIRQKVSNGFYNSPEVLEKVAEKVLQELTKE